MAKKENEEIKEAIEDYEVLIGDEEVKRLAELRLMSKLEENSALATARDEGTKKGLKEGEKIGLKYGKELGMKLGIEKGMQEGIEKGIKQGKKETKNRIAQKMLKEGIDIRIIEKTTGLNKEEINENKE